MPACVRGWPGGAADRLSPFKFYQYLLSSVPDADVIRFLKMLTFLPLDDIHRLQAAMAGDAYAPNTAQRLLAEEVTRLVHGEQGLQQALKATQVTPPRQQLPHRTSHADQGRGRQTG